MFICLIAAREPSSTSLQSFCFLLLLLLCCVSILLSSVTVPTSASIHNSEIALATDCVEDRGTDSLTEDMEM